ncbi:venom allergen 5-like [Periplaneta americana]|uniref:venom allergen 5-like n=1 Tax=Periplaneta americana TaxID=6978 RepID=UPI0037E96C69
MVKELPLLRHAVTVNQLDGCSSLSSSLDCKLLSLVSSYIMYVVLAALVIVAVAEDIDKYCKLCDPGGGTGDLAEHTMCLFEGIGSACTDVLDGGVTEDEKELILDVHNRLRAWVASGNETRGLIEDVPQPPAANMMALNWDEELAMIAQTWADQCTFSHDCRHVVDFKVGQNIAQYWNNLEPIVEWEKVIEGWYNEVGNWSADDTPKFIVTGNEMMTGHYTQLVWAETRFVGCGRRGFRNGPFFVEHYVCNYGPTGNYWDQPLYIIGDPCYLCPEDSECDNVLCVAGAGDTKDIYAYRYENDFEESSTINDLDSENATNLPEDNEVPPESSDKHDTDKTLWEKWIIYMTLHSKKH